MTVTDRLRARDQSLARIVADVEADARAAFERESNITLLGARLSEPDPPSEIATDIPF